MDYPDLPVKNEAADNFEFRDLRGLNLSGKDLTKVDPKTLITTNFDTQTKWPQKEKLPAEFDPEALMEAGKNPGLGLKQLHEQGIDGRGVRVAIIDQQLLLGHQEYSIHQYQVHDIKPDEPMSMHGTAVASLLVGRTCGVAPKAELFFHAAPQGKDFESYTSALREIIDFNRAQTDKSQKIQVVSCSKGYSVASALPGQKEWETTIQEARASGIILVDTTNNCGIEFVGGGSTENKDDSDSYQTWNDLKKRNLTQSSNLITIPSDDRTFASFKGPTDYEYNGTGGLSWSVPYLAGIFTLALQVNTDLKQNEIVRIINETTSDNKNGLRLINPKGIIERVKGTLTEHIP